MVRILCPVCGKDVKEVDEICASCGYELKKVRSQQPSKPEQLLEPSDLPPPLPPPPPPSPAEMKAESILGSFKIDHKSMYLTQYRLIVAKIGSGSDVTMGWLAGGIIGISLVQRGERKRMEKLSMLTPESILKADVSNFAIPYSGIIRVEMAKKNIKVIADRNYGAEMRRKIDDITKGEVYEYEKTIQMPGKYMIYHNIVRSVLADKVVLR